MCEKVGGCEVTSQEFYPQGSETRKRFFFFFFPLSHKGLFSGMEMAGAGIRSDYISLRNTECRDSVNLLN